ncbi:MAG TPA: hypothetical protein VFX05_04130 [Casimicrobiaceae bacterium]|nr:hypothetical protein [Casimicrobiaceae bacterium]
MIHRYRPERSPHVAALLGAAAMTGAILAGVHFEAALPPSPPVVTAVFTGEVTKDGPVYRLPPLEVRSRGGFLVALPDLVHRAAGALASHGSAGGKPNA